MYILTLRTDKPEAEIGLYEDAKQLAYYSWEAHRQLAETIHTTLQAMLESSGFSFEDVQGVVLFKGPGSFTGLRIGAAVANALADSLKIPIVGTMNPGWLESGIEALANGQNESQVVPEYGAPVHITQQKK